MFRIVCDQGVLSCVWLKLLVVAHIYSYFSCVGLCLAAYFWTCGVCATTINFRQAQLSTPWWWMAHDPKHVGVIFNCLLKFIQRNF